MVNVDKGYTAQELRLDINKNIKGVKAVQTRDLIAGVSESLGGAADLIGGLSALRNALIGVIPQDHFAIHTLTVLQNVCLPAVLFDKDSDVKSRAMELLKLLGISELAGSAPSELSGGELRRMSVARALINDPKVILADEPTGDLDDENTELIFEVLRKKAREGASVLAVTHENEAEKY